MSLNPTIENKLLTDILQASNHSRRPWAVLWSSMNRAGLAKNYTLSDATSRSSAYNTIHNNIQVSKNAGVELQAYYRKLGTKGNEYSWLAVGEMRMPPRCLEFKQGDVVSIKRRYQPLSVSIISDIYSDTGTANLLEEGCEEVTGMVIDSGIVAPLTTHGSIYTYTPQPWIGFLSPERTFCLYEYELEYLLIVDKINGANPSQGTV